eukprot:8274871-Karenia_brevis.AAC.1
MKVGNGDDQRMHRCCVQDLMRTCWQRDANHKFDLIGCACRLHATFIGGTQSCAMFFALAVQHVP